MTKAELVIKITLAAEGRLTRARSEALVDAVFGEIRQELLERGRFKYRDFGRWIVRKRAGRKAFNPHSRQPIDVAASKTVAFQPAQALQSRLGGRKV